MTEIYYAVKDLDTGLFLGHGGRWGGKPKLWSNPRYALKARWRWADRNVVVINIEVSEE